MTRRRRPHIRYSARELEFIEQRKTLPRRELHGEFVKEFGRSDIIVDDLHRLCKIKGWNNGRDGRYPKGAVPANKGKKMPFNANSAQTQFKKGHLSGKAAEIKKPIGTERVSREGYIERKIHNGLPMQSRWRAVHLLNWEKLHGPIAAGMALKCKGDKGNTDPSNWDLVPRAMLPRLNNRWGRNYDEASPELKATIMAVARLEHGLAEKSKQLTTCQRPNQGEQQ